MKNYRESYNLKASSGILFNHESPLRSERYVTQKIIKSAIDIKAGKSNKLELGNINITRDWGWAPDYVYAMYLIMQNEKPDDFVIATGNTHTLAEFIEIAFQFFNLNWKDYVISSKKLIRPNDITTSYANPKQAKEVLGWTYKKSFRSIIIEMIKDKLNYDNK